MDAEHSRMLPAAPTALFGREALIRDVAARLQRADVRMLTLTRPWRRR